MIKKFILLLALFPLFGFAKPKAKQAEVSVYDLRVENLQSPLGIATDKPGVVQGQHNIYSRRGIASLLLQQPRNWRKTKVRSGTAVMCRAMSNYGLLIRV